MIEVTVVEARELDKEDWLGKSDPLVEVWTQHEHIESTVSLEPNPGFVIRSTDFREETIDLSTARAFPF